MQRTQKYEVGFFELADIVRQTGYNMHCYHGHGHLEKVYENALAHRLRKNSSIPSRFHRTSVISTVVAGRPGDI